MRTILLTSNRFQLLSLIYILPLLVLGGCIDPESKIHTPLNKNVIIIGEFHGTEQIRHILVDTAQAQADHGEIAIGLEAPACALSTVFASSRLISLPGDSGEPCDMSGINEGRISTAMKAGVDKLLEDNKNAKIFSIENHEGRLITDFQLHANAWEVRAANRIIQIRDEGYRVISIAGNLHVRKTNYKFNGPETVPFGALLSDQALIIGIVPRNSGQVYACF